MDYYQTISDPAGEELQEYYCSYCNDILTVRLSMDEWYCNRCQITHIPQKETLKKKSKLVTPQRNTEPCISSIPLGYESIKVKKEPELQGSFKVLRDKGIKITSYSEDVGSRRLGYFISASFLMFITACNISAVYGQTDPLKELERKLDSRKPPQ